MGPICAWGTFSCQQILVRRGRLRADSNPPMHRTDHTVAWRDAKGRRRGRFCETALSEACSRISPLAREPIADKPIAVVDAKDAYPIFFQCRGLRARMLQP